MSDPDISIDPLITEAAKKAAITWVAVSGGPAKALWCTWLEDAICVVCGPGEQSDPGLAGAEECQVTLRGDHNGRIVTFTAAVVAVEPDSSDWDPVATGLAAKRLNATGGDTVARWATGNALYRLVPTAAKPQSGSGLPDGSLAAPVEPSSAARPTRKPFRLHRVKKRAS